MKRILCYVATLNSGGAEHQMVELITLLVEKGYDVTLLTRGNIPDHYTLPSGVKRDHVSNGRFIIERLLIHFFYFLRKKTDVVISFEQRENCFTIPAFFFRKKVKVICGERNLTYGHPSKFERLLMKVLYKRADYIVPNSYSQRDYLLTIRPEWSDKIITINNYTDTGFYVPKQSKTHEVINLVTLARFSPQKNYKVFAEVMKQLSDKTKKVCVNWYGNFLEEDEYNKHYLWLKEFIQNNCLQDTFYLHNHVKDVREVLYNADALCLPSLHEGFSNSIAEAISCGLPVLASDVSDNHIMVHDKENGYLFDPNSVESIEKAILDFVTLSEDERLLMGEKSRQIALSLFDKEEFVSKYISLIEN